MEILCNSARNYLRVTSVADHVPFENFQKSLKLLATVMNEGGKYMPVVNLVFEILIKLTDNAEAELQRKFESTAASIMLTVIKGKLASLRGSLACLENQETSGVHRISELTNSVNSLVEISIYFTDPNCILFKQYWIAAPIFLQIYVVASSIIGIAGGTRGYSNHNLGELASTMTKTLDGMERNCIAARLRGTHLRVQSEGRLYCSQQFDLEVFADYVRTDISYEIMHKNDVPLVLKPVYYRNLL